MDYSNAASDPIYRVGESEASDWLAYQPGNANGGAGFRAHPFTIEFDSGENPGGGLARLTLALLAYSARLPMLQVQINGRTGWFYQRTKLNYEGGDSGVFFIPYYSTAEVTCEFPAVWLRAGRNRIVLTAIDDPAERDDTRPSGFPWPGSSGAHYDAVRLETFPGPIQFSPKIEVIPTIFYSSQEALRERVDVLISNGSPPKQVVLKIGGNSWTNTLQPVRDFGQWRSQFDVPEFTPGTDAHVSVTFSEGTHDSNVSISPARKWTLFVVPNIHVDVGYTDYAAKVSELQSRILDRAIEYGSTNRSFRFTPDGFWPLEEFLKGRSADERQKLIQAVRAGTISVPAVHSSVFTGFASLENLIRQLYPSKRFAVRNNLPFEFALNTDVPSYSWSLASVLAASDVPYFVGASDAYRGPFLLYNRYNESSPHWWEGPDGRRVLTWYSRHYHQLASLFGLPYNLASGRDSLPRFLQAYDRPDYRSDGVIVYGSQVENVELHSDHRTLLNEWNKRYAYPRLQYASFPEALRYIVQQTGTNLPVLRGDGGPYWEDGLGANARTTALARANMYRILSAETAGTLAQLANSRFAADREMLANAWRNLLLIDEHTWHADQSVREPRSQQSLRQGELKDARAIEAEGQIRHVLDRGLAALADKIRVPSGSILVVNTLGWARSGWVAVDLPRGMSIFDVESGRSIPVEILSRGNAFDHVRFEAGDVPPLGYKCYAVRAGPGSREIAEQQESAELTNEFYNIKLDSVTGRIRSIVDRELQRELVNPNAAFGFGEYLYVSGGDSLPNRLVQYSTVSPLPELTIHGSHRSGRLAEVKRSAIGASARIVSSALNTPKIETEIFLPASRKRIELTYRVERTYTTRKEAAYFAFPLHVPEPRFRWATQNGIVDPTRDLLPGACLEWFLAHQWVSVGNDDIEVGWVPVDAPLFTLGDIVRGAWPKEFGMRSADVFSYIINNYTPEGYQAGQEGDHTFRYVLTSGKKLDPATLYRLGIEALTPLEINEITRNDKSGEREEWLSPKGSFLEIMPANVSLITWKSPEFTDGTILRLLETAGRETTVALRFPQHQIKGAIRCNAVEDERESLPFTRDSVTVKMGRHQIETIQLRLARP